MDANAKSSHDLARKVFWLNCAIAFATVVGACLGIWNIFYQCH